jgi:hypothetical protein
MTQRLLRRGQAKRVACEICSEVFKAQGYQRHKGSAACAQNVITRPVRLKALALREELLESKRPVKLPFVNACSKRDLCGFVGANMYMTKCVLAFNGQPFKVLAEWWVHQWVAELYASLSILRCTPNPTYKILEDLRHLPLDQQELAINLYVLRFAEL